MDPISSETREMHGPETEYAEDHAGGGRAPGADQEQTRDRRLLRFVYATAALTGILAVIIYAGDWFFSPSENVVQVANEPARIGTTPSSSRDGQPTADAPATVPPKPPEESKPPVPPTPVTPNREQAMASPEAEPSTESGGRTGKEAEFNGGQAEVQSAPATAKPGSAPTSLSAEPSPESRERADMKDEPGPGGSDRESAPVAARSKSVAAPSQPGPSSNSDSVNAKPEEATARTERKIASGSATDNEAPTQTPAEKPKDVAVATPKLPAVPVRSAQGRYYAQLGSVTSEARARTFWTKVKNQFPEILGRYDLIVQKRDVANRGTFYRVQVGGFENYKDVRGLCEMLKARKQGCLPIKR